MLKRMEPFGRQPCQGTPIGVQPRPIKPNASVHGATLYWLKLAFVAIFGEDPASLASKAAGISRGGVTHTFEVTPISRCRAVPGSDKEGAGLSQNAESSSPTSWGTRALNPSIFECKVRRLPNTLRPCASSIYFHRGCPLFRTRCRI